MPAGSRRTFSLAWAARGHRRSLAAVLKITLTTGGRTGTVLTRTLTR
jgi:hypothetical protein